MKFESVIAPLLVIGGLAVGAYAIKTWLIDPAAAAGQGVGRFIADQTMEKGGALTPLVTLDAYLRSIIQGQSVQITGFGYPVVPPTPEGFLPSNWVWQGPCDVKIGLPAGMTFQEFCDVSPGSPMCTPGYFGVC